MESQTNKNRPRSVESLKQFQQGLSLPQRELSDQELNETWRELLGLPLSHEEAQAQPGIDGMDAPVPTLESDPWSTLVQAQGNEAVDLQRVQLNKMHAPLSDQDVEQALQFLQDEMPAHDTREKKWGC